MPVSINLATNHPTRDRAYLQLLLRIRVAHTTLQDHGPESRIIQVVDMT